MQKKLFQIILHILIFAASLPFLKNASKLLLYANYAQLWKTAGLLLALYLFYTLATSREEPATDVAKLPVAQPRQWVIGAAAVIGICLIYFLWINPYGRIPYWSRTRKEYFLSGQRVQKLQMFQAYPTMPDILLLGSSRTFTISPGYLQSKVKKTAFNLGVAGGDSLDALALTRMALDKKKGQPQLIMVEFPNPTLNVENYMDVIPLDMFPYISPEINIQLGFYIFLRQPLQLESIADTSYIQMNDNKIVRIDSWLKYTSDGGAVHTPAAKILERYPSSLKEQIPFLYRVNQCDSLSTIGKQQIEELVKIAKARKIAILFYRTPLNSAYFEAIDRNYPPYKRCQNLFRDYMKQLTEENPNVFFKDLSFFPKIGDWREKYYVDAQHLNATGNKKLIDALKQPIITALKWANQTP